MVAVLADVEADDALDALFDSLVALALSLAAAAVALEAAAVAEDAALVLAVVADAASTIKDHFALSLFVVSGCEPDDVCAVAQIKMLLVLVSLTRSRIS